MNHFEFSYYGLIDTAWKVSKYGPEVTPCFECGDLLRKSPYSVRMNTGKYGPEITPCLDTFHAVRVLVNDSYVDKAEHSP